MFRISQWWGEAIKEEIMTSKKRKKIQKSRTVAVTVRYSSRKVNPLSKVI